MKKYENFDPSRALVTTHKDECRVCYTCVKECPAKAIRISGGQAEVIGPRCIGCGNCVRVCTQNAKHVRDSIQAVNTLLESDAKVAAIIAPSFPAEFQGIEYTKLVGMIRALGFEYVNEVSYGADLVAREYKKLVNEKKNAHKIATTCPAVVSYVEKYHPELVKFLAPIASPMVATARVLRKMHGKDLKVVFIGPCIAKKAEAERPDIMEDVSEALTFSELWEMFRQKCINASNVDDSDFDPPHPAKGTLFPIGRGMLEAANLREDLISNNIVTADGTRDFVQALKESEDGSMNMAFLEILCCNGCIMGSGMTTRSSQFTRRTAVSKYAQETIRNLNREEWDKTSRNFDDVDLSVQFQEDDHRMAIPSLEELKRILADMGKIKPDDELNCGACGYDSCVEHAVAIHKGYAEVTMCLPYTIERLKDTAKELTDSYDQLVKTKNALAQSEKLAGMGQLAAGIAHEVNNPLGVVLLYAHLLMDETQPDSEAYQDLKMVVEQAERAKKIVSGLLNFARKNKVVLVETNINDLINQSLKAIILPETITVETIHMQENIIAEIDPDQTIQVLSNLISNAGEAMQDGGKLTIISDEDDKNVIIKVKDTGTGIPPETLKRIFEPFFTTKQMGKGTGLGLAVTYGIIKMHHGRISTISNADPAQGPTGTTFTVVLPKKPPDKGPAMD